MDDAVEQSAGTDAIAGSTQQAGWYPDPETPGMLRWWDGRQWSEDRAPLKPRKRFTILPARLARHLPRWARAVLIVLVTLFAVGVVFDVLVSTAKPNRSWSSAATPEMTAFGEQIRNVARLNAGTDVPAYKAGVHDLAVASTALSAKLRTLGPPPAQAGEWKAFEKDLDDVATTGEALAACPSSCSSEVQYFSDAATKMQAAAKVIAAQV